MPKKKLTDPFIRNVTTEKKRIEISDEIKTGLVLRVTNKGHKSFSYKYRFGDKSKRFTIGSFPNLSLAQARRISDELHLKVKQGLDPQAEKQISRRRSDVITIKDLCISYKKSHFQKLKDSTRNDYRRRIDNEILPELGGIPIQDLSRLDIIEFLEDIAFERDAPVHSNRVRAILSSIYSFGMERALIDYNPVQTVKPLGDEKPRERVYSDEEIRSLWFAFEQQDYALKSVLQVLLLTAQRLGETKRMKWSYLKEGLWIIPSEETKSKRTHHVPLSNEVLKIINELKPLTDINEYVFESPQRSGYPIEYFQRASKRIRSLSGISDFRIHDLRRTAASYMAKLGTSRTVLGKILNHKGLAGDNKVTAIYDRYEYEPEKRRALENWSVHLLGIIEGERPKAKILTI